MPIFWIDSLRIQQALSNVLGIATRNMAEGYIQREIFRKRPYRFPGVFTSAIRLSLFSFREVPRMGTTGNMDCYSTTEDSEDPTGVELTLHGKTKTETIASACALDGYPPQPADGIVAGRGVRPQAVRVFPDGHESEYKRSSKGKGNCAHGSRWKNQAEQPSPVLPDAGNRHRHAL